MPFYDFVVFMRVATTTFSVQTDNRVCGNVLCEDCFPPRSTSMFDS